MVLPHPLYQRDTRAPVPLAPAGSCDCHFHVYGDPARYPQSEERTFEVPIATWDELQKMHQTLGVSRGVCVQATAYRIDHSLLLDVLRGQNNYRGVALIDDTVNEQELARLHEAGVRGARFNFAGFLKMAPSRPSFERSIARISELGWFAKVHGTGDELAALEAWLRPLRLPVVIDHLGGPDWRRGLDSPGYRLIFDLLKRENWWIQISNGDRRSAGEHPWEDMVAIVRALVDAASDRAIWATDWPHVSYQKSKVPNDADLLEYFYRCVPDEASRQRVLVANPERLLGFRA